MLRRGITLDATPTPPNTQPTAYTVKFEGKKVGPIFKFLGTWHIDPHSRGYSSADEAAEALVDKYLKAQQNMASTTDLLELQDEFPTAFTDPEMEPPAPEPDEEGRTGETPQASTVSDKKTWPELDSFDRINLMLQQIKHHPDLQDTALKVLEALAQQAAFREQAQKSFETFIERAKEKKLIDSPTQQTEPLLPNLPETYARQSSPDCPSGVCPIDH